MRQVRCAEFPLTIRPDIAAGADPGLAQARQVLLRITMERIIPPQGPEQSYIRTGAFGSDVPSGNKESESATSRIPTWISG